MTPDLAPSLASSSQNDYIKSEQQCATAIYQKYYDMPMYQRPYSWTLKNVDDLLGDLLNGYQTQSELFLGALVMFDGAVPGHYWTVDGQQRLTTFVMVLAFGMHWARSKGKDFEHLFGELKNMLWQPQRAMAKMPARCVYLTPRVKCLPIACSPYPSPPRLHTLQATLCLSLHLPV